MGQDVREGKAMNPIISKFVHYKHLNLKLFLLLYGPQLAHNKVEISEALSLFFSIYPQEKRLLLLLVSAQTKLNVLCTYLDRRYYGYREAVLVMTPIITVCYNLTQYMLIV